MKVARMFTMAMLAYPSFLLLVFPVALCSDKSAIFHVTTGSSNMSTQCAASCLGGVALRVRDGDGECEPLTRDWFHEKTYEDGYMYLETKMYTESFASNQMFGQLNTDQAHERLWSIPGWFGVNAQLDIYFTTPPEYYSWMWFRIFDMPIGQPFALYDDIYEAMLVTVKINNRDEEVLFSSFMDGVRYKAPELAGFTFDYNTTVKLTIKAQQDDMLVLFDDIPRASVPHIALPETAQTLVIRFGGEQSTWPKIEKVTFYGT